MLTNEQIKNLEKVFNANADKQLSLKVVLDTTLKALSTDVLTASIVKGILGENRSAERKHFMEVFGLCMPHYVLNGTHEIVIADFIAATDENKLGKTIRQYRLAVDEDIVSPSVCINYVETEREEPKTVEFVHESGYVQVINMRDAEGKVITETTKVQLVPRKKAVWGYTKDVKAALINAINIISEEK